MDTFWHRYSRHILKSLWRKEKLLIINYFPFATMFSALFYNLKKVFILHTVHKYHKHNISQTLSQIILVTFPFPHNYRHFLTPLQQTTFENIVKKEEIAQIEQFLILLQYFQLFSIPVIILLFTETIHFSAWIFSKMPATDFLYVGKG